MDRSRVHILLCDHNPSSSSETLSLLRKCSYQVTSVSSASHALNVLSSPLAAHVDLVLSEVELPQENSCSRLLKHIMGQECLRRIPVVVMSQRDDMAVVARCLRLGAVDYLVKPLRSNEVLNLWTHMWRRRRMLGLPDKDAIHTDSTPVVPVESSASGTSESNNSNTTGLVVEQREDSKRREAPAVHLQTEMAPHLELSLRLSSHYYAEPLTEQIEISSPKKSFDRIPLSGSTVSSPKEIKVKKKHASAFVTYMRANNTLSEQSAVIGSNSNLDDKFSEEAEKENDLIRSRPHYPSVPPESDEVVASEGCGDPLVGSSSISEKQSGVVDVNGNSIGVSLDRPPSQCEFTCDWVSPGGQVPVMPSFQQPYQGFYVSCASPGLDMRHGGFINQPLPSPSVQLYHHESFAGLPAMQSAALQPSHAFPVSNPFSFYSLAPIPSPQFVPFPMWPAMADSIPVMDCKLRQAERREAALNKFRLKRKDRCFEKKIRYASRKKLAEQRPRVKGQFVRRATIAEDENRDGLYDEEEEDEQSCCELEANSSPESIAENSKAG